MAPPNRADRAGTEAAERRRRFDGTLDASLDLKLIVPEAARQQFPDHEFRYANDIPGRIDRLYRQDWDKVPGVDPIVVGTDKFGKPQQAFLLSKPKQFQRDDDARKETARREVERLAISGGSVDARDDVDPSKRYVPDGNSIKGAYAP